MTVALLGILLYAIDLPLTNMHVESLKVFCDLAETGSFSAAAERNLLTQSAVSQQIRALEKRYTVTLIERGGKQMSLTAEGQVFLQAAEQMLEIYTSIPEKILRAGEVPRGEVKVATVTNLGLHELEEVRRLFKKKYPFINVQKTYLEWEAGYAAVESGEVDFALLPFPEKREGYVVETVWHERLVLVCPPNHRLARYGSVGMRDLRGERFVWSASDRYSSETMSAIFKKAKVDVDVVLDLRYPDAVKRAIRVEGLLGILPEQSVIDENSKQTLKIVEINSSDMWLPIGIVSKKCTPMSLPASELVRELRDYRFPRGEGGAAEASLPGGRSDQSE